MLIYYLKNKIYETNWGKTQNWILDLINNIFL